MKFYDFLSNKPIPSTIVIIEGTDRLLAEQAVSVIIDRVIGNGDRALNLDRIDANDKNAIGSIEEAAAAFAFLAPARVVQVRNVHELKSDSRKLFWKMAQRIPAGNVIVCEDLIPTTSKRPEPLSKSAPKGTLTIDTTVDPAIRSQFAADTIRTLNIQADRSVVDAIGHSNRDLFSIQADLQKIALYNRPITIADVLAECLNTTEAKVFEFAGLLVEGKKAEALALASELLGDDKGAAIPMLHSLITAYLIAFDICRTGCIPPKLAWQASKIRPVAKQIGERQSKIGVERGIKAFEAIVTGKFDDPLTVILLCIDTHPLTAKTC